MHPGPGRGRPGGDRSAGGRGGRRLPGPARLSRYPRHGYPPGRRMSTLRAEPDSEKGGPSSCSLSGNPRIAVERPGATCDFGLDGRLDPLLPRAHRRLLRVRASAVQGRRACGAGPNCCRAASREAAGWVHGGRGHSGWHLASAGTSHGPGRPARSRPPGPLRLRTHCSGTGKPRRPGPSPRCASRGMRTAPGAGGVEEPLKRRGRGGVHTNTAGPTAAAGHTPQLLVTGVQQGRRTRRGGQGAAIGGGARPTSP